MRFVPLALSLVVLGGCGGDPRDPFLGMFEGDGVYKVQWAGEPEQRLDFKDRIYVTVAEDSSALFVSEFCGMRATMRDANTLNLLPATCTFEVSDCQVSESIGEGTATLAGDQLVLDYVGDRFDECPDGTLSATTTTHVEASRR